MILHLWTIKTSFCLAYLITQWIFNIQFTVLFYVESIIIPIRNLSPLQISQILQIKLSKQLVKNEEI